METVPKLETTDHQQHYCVPKPPRPRSASQVSRLVGLRHKVRYLLWAVRGVLAKYQPRATIPEAKLDPQPRPAQRLRRLGGVDEHHHAGDVELLLKIFIHLSLHPRGNTTGVSRLVAIRIWTFPSPGASFQSIKLDKRSRINQNYDRNG